MRSSKVMAFASILMLVPIIGVPVYEKFASEKILRVQTKILEEQGWKIKYSDLEKPYLSMHMNLRDVQMSKDDIAFTASKITIPLIPYMSIEASDVTINGKFYNIKSSSISGVLGTSGWSDVNLKSVMIYQDDLSATADNMDIELITNMKMKNVKARNVLFTDKKWKSSIQTLFSDTIDISENPLQRAKHIDISNFEFHLSPEMLNLFPDIPITSNWKINDLHYVVEMGDENDFSDKTTNINIGGLKMSSLSEGKGYIKFTKNHFISVMDGVGFPKFSLNIDYQNSITFSKLFIIPTIKSAKLELSDPSGNLNRILQIIENKQNLQTKPDNRFLPLWLVSNKIMKRDGAVAVLNWLRDPTRTLIITSNSIYPSPTFNAFINQ